MKASEMEIMKKEEIVEELLKGYSKNSTEESESLENMLEEYTWYNIKN